MKKGEYLNVSSLLDVYSRNNGTDKDYLLLRAELQRDWNKNISAASSTIQTALNLYPDDIDVLLMAASIMASSGQKIGQKSLRDVLDTVLKKDPNNAFAQELLISEYLNLEDWNSAYNLSFSLMNMVKENYKNYLSSGQIINIASRMLFELNPKLVEHNVRTAYIAFSIFQNYKMPEECTLQNLVVLSLFHTVGFYRPDFFVYSESSETLDLFSDEEMIKDK